MILTMFGRVEQPSSSLGIGMRSYLLKTGLRGISLGGILAMHPLRLPAVTWDFMKWSTGVSFRCSEAWWPHSWQLGLNCNSVLYKHSIHRNETIGKTGCDETQF